jgi:hypothetical protein
MKGNKIMKEKISALADGELSDFETRRVLNEISSNPEYREFWRSIQLTKLALEEEDSEIIGRDLSQEIYNKLNKSKPEEQLKEPKSKYLMAKYMTASCLGFIAVISYTFLPEAEITFSEKATDRIVKAIDSPQAMEVLNSSVSELNVELQDFQSNATGTLANYKDPGSGETFKVSLYPIQEINKMNITGATKISYIKSKDKIYVLSVTGSLSPDKKNQILQRANFFADQLNK